MLKVSINGKVRELPSGELYEDDFKEYSQNGYIDLESLPLEERYHVIDELFGFVSRTIVVVLGTYQEEFPNYKYSEEIYRVRRKISSVDSMQKFLHKSGNTESSIKVIEKFMEEMIDLWDKTMAPEQEQTQGVRRVG